MEWISVKDKLPTEQPGLTVKVFVLTSDENIHTSWYNKEEGFQLWVKYKYYEEYYNTKVEVTHWVDPKVIELPVRKEMNKYRKGY